MFTSTCLSHFRHYGQNTDTNTVMAVLDTTCHKLLKSRLQDCPRHVAHRSLLSPALARFNLSLPSPTLRTENGHKHARGCIGNNWCCLYCCRQQEYAAEVQIASQGASTSPSESLSFGEYNSSNVFQTHASLSTQSNGSLSVLSSDLSMLPSQGTAAIGSGDGLVLFACGLPCTWLDSQT